MVRQFSKITAQQSVHPTLGTAAFGGVRNSKPFSTPFHFSGWTASPSPPQRRYPLKGTMAQTVGR